MMSICAAMAGDSSGDTSSESQLRPPDAPQLQSISSRRLSISLLSAPFNWAMPMAQAFSDRALTMVARASAWDRSMRLLRKARWENSPGLADRQPNFIRWDKIACHDQRTAVTVDFQNIFTGERMGFVHECNQDFIDDAPVIGRNQVAMIQVGGFPKEPNPAGWAGKSGAQFFGIRAA